MQLSSLYIPVIAVASVAGLISCTSAEDAPVRTKGLAMIDARDVGEIAAIELIRREQSATPLPLSRPNASIDGTSALLTSRNQSSRRALVFDG